MGKGGGKVGAVVGLGCAAALCWALSVAGLGADPLPLAIDLQADASAAASRDAPILLMFASETCSYCHQVEEDYLRPLANDAAYADKVLVRKLLVQDLRPVVDFDGTRVAAARIADRYRVHMVPTLVFVDGRGREIGERLTGLTTVDFYWGYLQRSLDLAHEQLRAGAD